MFLKSQQLLAAGDCMNLSFINKQKLTCMWPENLQVMRTTLETCRGRSWRVRATVGVISSGQGPQTTLGLLISTCHQADFISHCPDDRGSCKGYLTPCGQPSVLANRLLTSRVSVFLRGQSGGKPKMRKSGLRAQSAGHSQARASLFWRILGVDLPLTPSVQ